MTDFHAEIQPYFSLDPLRDYNPDNPEDMAQILIGAYRINSTAIDQATELHEEQMDRRNLAPAVTRAARSARGVLLSMAARDNLESVAHMLDGRQVVCHAIDAAAAAIRYQGLSPVPSVSGWPNVDAVNPMLRLAPEKAVDILRLYPHVPLRQEPEARRYTDVEVVDFATNEPLVEVEIGSRESIFRRGARSIIQLTRDI